MLNGQNNNMFPQKDEELTAFLNELKDIPWFQNVGKPISKHDVKQVSSWDEAWACLQDERWANASFHQHLSSVHSSWQEAYDRALQIISSSPYNHELEEGVSAAAAAAYDVAGAAFEIATESNDKFFYGLMDWYRLGHWPCGWDGDYPEGKLIVF